MSATSQVPSHHFGDKVVINRSQHHPDRLQAMAPPRVSQLVPALSRSGTGCGPCPDSLLQIPRPRLSRPSPSASPQRHLGLLALFRMHHGLSAPDPVLSGSIPARHRVPNSARPPPYERTRIHPDSLVSASPLPTPFQSSPTPAFGPDSSPRHRRPASLLAPDSGLRLLPSLPRKTSAPLLALFIPIFSQFRLLASSRLPLAPGCLGLPWASSSFPAASEPDPSSAPKASDPPWHRRPASLPALS